MLGPTVKGRDFFACLALISLILDVPKIAVLGVQFPWDLFGVCFREVKIFRLFQILHNSSHKVLHHRVWWGNPINLVDIHNYRKTSIFLIITIFTPLYFDVTLGVPS